MKSAIIKTLAIVTTGFLSVTAAQAGTGDATRQAAWRQAIARTPVPGGGCFQASYPLTVWKQVQCVVAPNRPYVPASGAHGAETTGDGHDYAAGTASLTQSAVGSFPKVKGLKSETGAGGRANYYSLQLNSNFMKNSQACANAFNPSNCSSWEQFVYSSSSRASFMQYWLIHYTGTGVTCPAGWNKFSDDCYKNSAAVGVPLQPITELPNISISGTAVHGGIDTFVTTTATQAYTTTGADTVAYLADNWTGSEFNVVGDGGGSAANFNAGTKLTVQIDVATTANEKPTCESDAGTTGETNNLNLGVCKAKPAKGAKLAHISFVESLPKK